jgi:hypothetical protein
VDFRERLTNTPAGDRCRDHQRESHHRRMFTFDRSPVLYLREGLVELVRNDDDAE